MPETLEKEEARELARRIITKHLERLISKQVENARGCDDCYRLKKAWLRNVPR
jgi:hypothetical protein